MRFVKQPQVPQIEHSQLSSRFSSNSCIDCDNSIALARNFIERVNIFFEFTFTHAEFTVKITAAPENPSYPQRRRGVGPPRMLWLVAVARLSDGFSHCQMEACNDCFPERIFRNLAGHSLPKCSKLFSQVIIFVLASIHYLVLQFSRLTYPLPNILYTAHAKLRTR